MRIDKHAFRISNVKITGDLDKSNSGVVILQRPEWSGHKREWEERS